MTNMPLAILAEAVEYMYASLQRKNMARKSDYSAASRRNGGNTHELVPLTVVRIKLSHFRWLSGSEGLMFT